MIRYAILVFVVLGCLWAAAGAQPEAMNETLALDVTTPYPTLIHLAVEWRILGDDDLDGVVSVRFREIGTSEWRDGMPLRRVPKGRLAIPRRWWRRDAEEVDGPPPLPNRIFEWANKHSGSLFDLMSDTEYEIELSLHDPDGGDAVKRVRARTRPEPRAMPNAPITRVTPETLRTLKPTAGDVVLLGAGDYGTFVARFDGEPGKPIVYRSDDGAARFTQIDLIGRSYVHVEGVTVVNPERRGKGIDLMGAEFWNKKKPYCFWSIFQRGINVPSIHGPPRFSLLYLCADGVAAFQALYYANSASPKAVAVIQPGTAFGGNWTDFEDPYEIFARTVLGNPKGRPQILLNKGAGYSFREQCCWPSYTELICFLDISDRGIGVFVEKDKPGSAPESNSND